MTESTPTVAETLLLSLRDRGVQRLYVNAGTDFPSVVEAYAHASEAKLDLPEAVVAVHENLAVGMAHGAYLVSGRPQAVMVHVSVGTANALCGLMNAARDRVPLVLIAGRTPITEEGLLGSRSGGIHWAQEMFDQAGMLRELVKWDYELRDAMQVHTVVDRAVGLAMSEPRGPVYLTLPREVLARDSHGSERAIAPLGVASDPFPQPEAVEHLAGLLSGARFPVIVTSAAGADRRSVRLLAKLSSRHAIGVVENMPRYVSMPGDHPHHLGYRLPPVFQEADVLCFVECEVPWIQTLEAPDPDAVIVHAGADPLFSRYPIRSHRSDLAITSTPRNLFTALGVALEGRAVPEDRAGRLASAATRIRQAEAARYEDAGRAAGPITKAALNWALAQVRTQDSIVVNEYWAEPSALRPAQPGTYFRYPPAGGLGWGLPAALGAKQAAPDRTVIAALGDGAYLFANPAACHQAAAMHDLPVLSVICTNSSWGAVASAARAMYPGGRAASLDEVPLSGLSPMPQLEKYVEASGGHGETVGSLRDLLPALERGLEKVTEQRRQAVISVICEG